MLVEEFKLEAIHKIELHRSSMGKPLLCHTDPNIVAVATDKLVNAVPEHLAILNLNNPQEIVSFIRQYMQ